MQGIVICKLTELREAAAQTARLEFEQRYPGAFLVAIGYLATESRVQPGEPGHSSFSVTMPVRFGLQMRHQLSATHPLAGQAFFLNAALGSTQIKLGRGAERDLVIPDPSVSDWHCSITTAEGAALVYDHHSTNGTTVNLTPVAPDQPRELADQDILTLGRYSFQVMSAGTLYDELALLRALDETETQL